jgi:hypothetical protein
MDINRKRKSNNDLYNNKKQCCVNWNEMISPSNIRNYMLDDPLIDWMRYYSINDINDTPKHNHYNNHHNHHNNSLTFNNFIMEQGKLFEKNVIEHLKQTNFRLITIAETYEDVKSYNKYMETINAMTEGYDIIYQGVLHDYNYNLYGSPDLLIRSDKFNQIFNNNINIKEKKTLFGNYHYIVVDIKHSTINLNCNKTFIKDINSVIYYKGQIYIYNKILGNMQKYLPDYGFILSKKVMYTKNNIIHCCDNYMENLSMINYKTIDKHIINKVSNAISWINKMRTHGINWKLLPTPSVPELYPNMKNDKDDGYRLIKSKLADILKEITNIWWCSFKKRTIAHSKKVYNWMDTKFNASLIDIKDDKVGRTLNNILDINRSNSNIIRISELIKTNHWKTIDNDVLELYIDFETLNSNMGQLEITNMNLNIIFMITIGWDINNQFDCKTFMINKNNDNDEYNMINNMWEFIDIKMKELNKVDYKFIHWSNAEITFYNKFKLKHNNVNFNEFKSFDLYKLFIDNNIVVKGALNFSLKSIASAFYKNKLINSCWETSSCNNGLQAMYLAYNLYKNNNIVNETDMKDIIKYNIIDCKVMWEILSYLRNNF